MNEPQIQIEDVLDAMGAQNTRLTKELAIANAQIKALQTQIANLQARLVKPADDTEAGK